VITALRTAWPSWASAISFNRFKMSHLQNLTDDVIFLANS
jgi:hypothetical protein